MTETFDELQQRQNGSQGKFAEIGTIGLNAFAGAIQEAYNRKLYWPSVVPLYDRIFDSDPEVSIIRLVMDTMSSEQSVSFELDPEIENPTSDDLAAVDFGNEVLDDIEGGISKWFNAAMTRVPLYGWGWWEAVPCVRLEKWRPPEKDDPWRSEYNDGRIGFRRLGFRRYSSFYAWDMSEETGRVMGLVQHDLPNEMVTIPTDRSLHLTFGDRDNPEGLATMQAIWRLERIKYGLELIQGIGFEHSAGYFQVTVTDKEQLTATDHATIKKAARAVMAAQEGNYVALPANFEGGIQDASFDSATALLDAIRYYGILKLAVINMQWVALGALTPYGSYSTVQDSNAFFVNIYNSMSDGMVKQADEQIGKRLFNVLNPQAFPGMTKRPRLSVTKAQKMVGLDQLGSFATAISTVMPLGEDDFIALRRKSGFMPEVLPEDELTAPIEEEEDMTEGEAEQVEGEAEQDMEDEERADLAFRPFVPAEDEHAISVENLAVVTPQDVARAVRKFGKWAEENDPDLFDILNAKPIFPVDENETMPGV